MPAKIARPATHHIDKRAEHIVGRAPEGNADDLLSTKDVATWLGVSVQWLEIGRHREYGPKYVRLSTRRVRYRRSDIIGFLNARTHARTAEYMTNEKVGRR